MQAGSITVVLSADSEDCRLARNERSIMRMNPCPKPIYFHVGLHKTATGWFQRRLFPRLQGLEVCREANFGKIAALASEQRSTRLIISSEGMSGRLAVDKVPGECDQVLRHSLSEIARIAPDTAILIGFREHSSWVNSAFGQKARKVRISPERYLKSFSLEELLWSRRLEVIDASFDHVFPFFYEELAYDPESLVSDMCRFFDVRPLERVVEIANTRENPSPRSELGQLVSRPFFWLSKTMEGLGLGEKKQLRDFGAGLGASLDQLFTKREVEFDTETKRHLGEDWQNVLQVVGSRRHRDFSCLGKHPSNNSL